MIAKLTTKSSLTSFLAGIPIVALAGAFALGMAVTTVTPHSAFAEVCPATGDDHNDDSNTACGDNAEAHSDDDGADADNTAIGSFSTAGDPNDTGGQVDEGSGINNVAVGTDSTAGFNTLNQDDAAGFGSDDNVAVGHTTVAGDGAGSDRNTAIGGSATAGSGTGITGTVAVGNSANASAIGAIAIGGDDDDQTASATASGDTSIAIGNETTASGTGAIAIGGDISGAGTTDSGANAAGDDAISIGARSSAGGTGSIAVGTLATASHTNAAAFGAGVSTTRADQYIFGGATNTYTTPGIVSQASRDEQSGPLEIVTSDAAGNLATAGGEFIEQINRNEEGVAMAMSLGGFWVPYQKRFAMSAGVGLFNDAVAASVQMGLQVSDNVHITGGLAIGTSGQFSSSQVGGRANVLVAF